MDQDQIKPFLIYYLEFRALGTRLRKIQQSNKAKRTPEFVFQKLKIAAFVTVNFGTVKTGIKESMISNLEFLETAFF